MGNSSEFKNSIIFDEAEVPHFNYVGDSIVGYKGHLAAGVILSNVRLDRAEITVTHKGGIIPTGLRKFGAIIGDRAEIGCNSVLSPGSIIGRNTLMYPGTQWRGAAPENSIIKYKQNLEIIPRRG
jgi:bifunctional N-acetylglucosamine-1-phosphate-uridyltransferase/glucosamine-1-phosphate-acetyltransferase GlmU-like protein